MEEQEIIYKKVILVGLDTGEEEDFDHSMEELQELAKAAYKQVVGILVQKKKDLDKALYIGTGKVQELKEFIPMVEAEEIIFDNTLSPSQIRNLGHELELPIIDRTNLILDIFAIRAKTREAKLQVETARLQYMLPRLVGMRENLSRQGGTGGSMSNKGAGETKLELDRRKIEHRIHVLKKELEDVARTRDTMRKKRNRSKMPQVALVGYTNAGKSTIMNRLVERFDGNEEKTVFEKDMLFATLETNVRTIQAGDNKPFLLTDTVGFINKLPHGLVKAFHSTLEELRYADLLLHVVDFSDEHYRTQIQVTEDTLRELEIQDIPKIVVYNKVDKCDGMAIPQIKGDHIYMAAKSDVGIDELVAMIQERVYSDQVEVELLIPYHKGNLVSRFLENESVSVCEHRADGVYIKMNCSESVASKYEMYKCL